MKILQTLRLLDENKQLSLTNLAVMITLGKLALADQASLENIGALLLALLAYHAKRHTVTKAESHKKVVEKAEAIEASAEELKAIKSKLQGIEAVMGMKGIK